MVEFFFERLKEELITDILQIGVVDIENGIAEMTTMHKYLFIKFGGTIVKFESIDQYSKLKINYVNSIEFGFELDDDMWYAKNSVAELVLNDTMANNRIKFIDVFGLDCSDDFCIGDAVSFNLLCGQKLFLDPTYFFGINIGGARQEKLWYDNFSKPFLRKRINL